VQLIDPDEEGRSRAEEVSVFSRELKLLALELGIAVVAAAQLNREVEKRRDKFPQMGDLRESGSLEQDADTIMLIHRPEYYDPKEENRGVAHLDVCKNRDGATGIVDLRFVGEFMRFEDVPEPEPAWRQAARERERSGADA
jgi:replicative DNA helicase